MRLIVTRIVNWLTLMPAGLNASSYALETFLLVARSFKHRHFVAIL